MKLKKSFEQFKKKYAKNSHVIFGILPSIEFWFLLHFVDTTKPYLTSKSVISHLVKYVSKFDKIDSFLRNKKKVENNS